MGSLHSRAGELAQELAAAIEDPSSDKQAGRASVALEALLVELRRVVGEKPRVSTGRPRGEARELDAFEWCPRCPAARCHLTAAGLWRCHRCECSWTEAQCNGQAPVATLQPILT